LEADLGKAGLKAEARRILLQLEAENSQDPELMWSLGNLHFWVAAAQVTHEEKAREFEKSLEYFERLRKMEPGNLARWTSVSLLHKQLGNEYTYLERADKVCVHGEAAVRMDEARLKADPESVRVQMDLNTSQGIVAGCARMRDGNRAFLKAYAAVLEGRRRLLTRDPANSWYQSRLASALARQAHILVTEGAAAEALPMVEEGLRLKETDVHEELQWTHAWVLEKLGRWEEACAAFTAVRSSRSEVAGRFQGTARLLHERCGER
jgi:tetratricopeptide (TPR) repeat protein